MGGSSSRIIDAVWFDESINSLQNKGDLENIKPLFNYCFTCDKLEEGFSKFYSDTFIPIFTIVRGRL